MINLRLGDCLEVMKELPANSVDSIVTDPPYGLSFMGKDWDHGVPGDHFWIEALRVAKPGAHLLAFGGTRTFHRLAVAIEDAGWEIRDCVMWVYGSGFPKSHDVSKAIDKRGGVSAEFSAFRDDVREAMKRNGITRARLQDALGNFMLSHYLTDGVQPAIPTFQDYCIIRDTVKLGHKWDALFRDEAEREIIGTKDGNLLAVAPGQDNDRSSTTLDITAPATPAAKQWEGWGTALKPAWEPIIVARKPFTCTVAQNVQAWGTGAINVDGCRVGTPFEGTRPKYRMTSKGAKGGAWANQDAPKPKRLDGETQGNPFGRWPANFIHDGSDEVMELTGDAARFFYCAKASKRDRDEGCEGLEENPGGGLNGRNDSNLGSQTVARNVHPTVKPTALMRYLCKLVTPPGGIILDPFMGSGSTGKAAVIEGFSFIGIDLNPEYVEIAKRRIEFANSYLVELQPALEMAV